MNHIELFIFFFVLKLIKIILEPCSNGSRTNTSTEMEPIEPIKTKGRLKHIKLTLLFNLFHDRSYINQIQCRFYMFRYFLVILWVQFASKFDIFFILIVKQFKER